MASDPYALAFRPEFVEDLRRLAASTEPRDRRLLQVTLAAVKQIGQGRENGMHTLGWTTGTADLRDCDTTYLSEDPRQRPSHRLVWRQLAPGADGRTVREMIVVGTRDGSVVYDSAGERLGREVGVKMPELRNLNKQQRRDRSTGREYSTRSEGWDRGTQR